VPSLSSEAHGSFDAGCVWLCVLLQVRFQRSIAEWVLPCDKNTRFAGGHPEAFPVFLTGGALWQCENRAQMCHQGVEQIACRHNLHL
jgi:hypothetical protein